MESGEEVAFWRGAAWRTRARFNTGWWLDKALIYFAVASFSFASVVFVVRTFSFRVAYTLSGSDAALLYLSLLLASSYAAYRVAKRQFFSIEDAYIWLDLSLGLENRLSTAAAGVGSWPAPERSIPAGTHWNWRRILPAVLIPSVTVFLALLVPLKQDQLKQATAAGKPLPIAQLQVWMEELRNADVVEPQTLAALDQKLSALAQSDESMLFKYSTLEGAESMRDSLSKEMQSLSENLANAQEALQGEEQARKRGDKEEAEEMQSQLADATKSLGASNLPLKKELQKELEELAKKQSSETKRQKAMEQLKRGIEQLKSAPQSGGKSGKSAAGKGKTGKDGKTQQRPGQVRGDTSPRTGQNGQQGQGNGTEGKDGSSGGVSKGPGSVPLDFKDPTYLDSPDKNIAVGSGIDESSLPDEYSGQSLHLPEAGKDGGANGSAGNAGNGGNGERVTWGEELTPRDQTILKQFFK